MRSRIKDELSASVFFTFGFAACLAYLFLNLFKSFSYSFSFDAFIVPGADVALISLFCLLSFSLLFRMRPARQRVLYRPFSLLIFSLVMCAAALLRLFIPTTSWLLFLSGFCIGVPWPFLFCAWISGFADKNSIYVFASFMLAALISLLLVLLDPYYEQALLSLLPLLSSCLLFVYRHWLAADNKDLNSFNKAVSSSDEGLGLFTVDYFLSSPEERSLAIKLTDHLTAAGLLYGLSASLMQCGLYANAAFEDTGFIFAMLILLLFCISAFQFFNDYSRETKKNACNIDERFPLEAFYRVVFMILMLGVLAVGLTSLSRFSAYTVFLSAYLALLAVFIALCVKSARLSETDPAQLSCRALYYFFSGQFLGFLCAAIIEHFQLNFMFALGAGCLCLISFLFLCTSDDFAALLQLTVKVDSLDECRNALSQKFALSARETEVLGFALRGRSGERIANELYISKSTVETHLRRIYAKMGIHNRQELIDLVEELFH